MYSFIYITTSGVSESKKIAKILLKEKLVACTNIVPRIESMYLWNGEIEEDSESLLIAKTLSSKVPEVTEMVKSVHSYDIPCILEFEIKSGSQDYLEWMGSELLD